MSKTTEHLSKLGFTSKEAHDYIKSNLNTPSEIYKVSDKYDITTEMLTEIMGGAITQADVKKYMSKNGYDTDVLDLTTEEYLVKKGANVQEIHNQIMTKLKSPAAILALSKQYALTTDMLDDILTEFDADDISGYFKEHDMDENELDHHYVSGTSYTEVEDDTEHVTVVGSATIDTTVTTVV